MPRRQLKSQAPEQVPGVAESKPVQETENAQAPATSEPASTEPPAPDRWQATKERYALAKYQPYADAVARLQPTADKYAESTRSLNQLRVEVEHLSQAAKQAQAEAVDAQAGRLLGGGSETQVAESRQKARAAQRLLEEAQARLQEAEQIHVVVQRAQVKAQEEVLHQVQAAKGHLQPRIRAEHEAAVRRVAMAFRELSAALADEQAIRDAVEFGPVPTLNSLGDKKANVRQFIHTEVLIGNTLDWLIHLDKFQYGEWIDGFRKRGYPVD